MVERPPPQLRGPNFAPVDLAEGAENDPQDVIELQRLLRARKLLPEGDGESGELTAATVETVKRFQREAGLVEDGVVGPRTKQILTAAGLADDAKSVEGGAKLAISSGATVTWTLDVESVPAYLNVEQVPPPAAFDATRPHPPLSMPRGQRDVTPPHVHPATPHQTRTLHAPPRHILECHLARSRPRPIPHLGAISH